MPRQVDPRPAEEYRRIYREMSDTMRRRAREFYDELPRNELRRLGVPDGRDSEELGMRSVVRLAEELIRRDNASEAEAEAIEEMNEDYGVTDATE